ncbi:MAG: hypothetical protein ACE5F7_09070 [Nitrospiria bacterium]
MKKIALSIVVVYLCLSGLMMVRAGDLEIVKGHAIVEVASDKVKPNQLIKAVQTIQGNGWYCTVELMCETGKLCNA